MSEFRARISRVRMKNGGADVVVLHNDASAVDHIPTSIELSARHLAGMSEHGSELVGYAIVGLYADGKSSVGWNMPSNYPPTLAAAWAIESVRRSMVCAPEAGDVFNDMFQWVE